MKTPTKNELFKTLERRSEIYKRELDSSIYFQAVEDTLTYLRGSTGFNAEPFFWQDCMDHAEEEAGRP